MKLKVLLVYCSFSKHIIAELRQANAYIPKYALVDRSYPPLGLLYLASALRKNNFDVDFIDITFSKNGFQEVLSIISRDKPIVTGIYVASKNLPVVKMMISKIKCLSPETIIVVGGPHVHYEPICVRYLNADFGIVSDGELAFVELVKALINKSSAEEIPNIVRIIDNKLHINKVEMIRDLDSIPFPARDLWPYKAFSVFSSGRFTSLISSRGCLFNCFFCATIHKGTYRVRSAKNVIEELKFLERQGIQHVDFLDDNMTGNLERVEELCNEIISARIKIKWDCMSRIDSLEKKLLKLMKRANCVQIKYGIESGSERVRNILIGKNILDHQIKQALKDTKDAGMSTFGFFVLGMPGETYEEAKKTLEFSRQIPLDYVEFRYATPSPGSKLFQAALQQNKITADIWQRLADGEPSAYNALETFVPLETQKMVAQAMRSHYLNINFLIKEIFIRTDNFQALLNKLKILMNNKFNAYLIGFYDNSNLSYFLNCYNSFLDKLLAPILRLFQVYLNPFINQIKQKCRIRNG